MPRIKVRGGPYRARKYERPDSDNPDFEHKGGRPAHRARLSMAIGFAAWAFLAWLVLRSRIAPQLLGCCLIIGGFG
jgi:hypothetical protein